MVKFAARRSDIRAVIYEEGNSNGNSIGPLRPTLTIFLAKPGGTIRIEATKKRMSKRAQ